MEQFFQIHFFFLEIITIFRLLPVFALELDNLIT